LLALVRDRLPARPVRLSDEVLALDLPPPGGHDLEERLSGPAPLHVVRSLLRAATPHGAEPFAALAFGIVSFEHGAFGDVALAPPGDNEFPDFIFWIADSMILFEPGGPPQLFCASFETEGNAHFHDCERRLQRLVAACEAAAPVPMLVRASRPRLIEADIGDAEFAELVVGLKEEIAAGELFQIVPSRTFRAPCSRPLEAFEALSAAEGESYRFYVHGAGFTLLGASPETSVRLTREEGAMAVEIRPIAGTRPRGSTIDEDSRLEAELRLDPKEQAEHVMLVDLARNDIARISEPGTCRVAKLLDVERHSKVMHLVSSVTGRLRSGMDAFDALAACLNVGTLSGAPKIRATELLCAVEDERRGPYGGAIGWINGAGEMDTAVIIRSALVQGGVASVRAGAGVVYDSDPQAEAEETRRKASALLAVLAGAEEQEGA
jgi:anthranilate synthase component 1